MKYYVCYESDGEIIEEVKSIEEGKKRIKELEEADKKAGMFEPNMYDMSFSQTYEEATKEEIKKQLTEYMNDEEAIFKLVADSLTTEAYEYMNNNGVTLEEAVNTIASDYRQGRCTIYVEDILKTTNDFKIYESNSGDFFDGDQMFREEIVEDIYIDDNGHPVIEVAVEIFYQIWEYDGEYDDEEGTEPDLDNGYFMEEHLTLTDTEEAIKRLQKENPEATYKYYECQVW